MVVRAQEMRRRSKTKARNEDYGRDDSTVLTSDTVSMSPSVREILGLADVDDDNSSFISATGSSFASVFHSVGSFSRRKSRAASAAAAPTKNDRSNGTDGGRRNSAKQEPKHQSKSKYSTKPSKRRTYADEETGNDVDLGGTKSMAKNLHFIDEDSVSIIPESRPQQTTRSKQHRSRDNGHTTSRPPQQRSGSSKDQRRKDDRNNPSLDDISHLPAAGNLPRRSNHGGYDPVRKRDGKSDSPLERKISGNVASQDLEMKEKRQNKRQHGRQERQRPSSSGRHRNRS